MDINSPQARDRIRRRLRRIEGQVRGIERMIDEGRDCREVAQQLAAVRAAVQQAALDVMRTYASQCLSDPTGEVSREELLDYLVDTLGRA
jgi:DNA-binding FrmR family transcriptional regulator